MTSLINVALGKFARQSSLSPWSTEDEAQTAVSGVMPGDFAFHTEREIHPWWEVDLGQTYSIEVIVIHNRICDAQERAYTLRVEVASEDLSLRLIHAGFAYFGGRDVGDPLTLRLGSSIKARYVRLSLDASDYLHLAQVEVWARADVLALDGFRANHNLTKFDVEGRGTDTPYALVSTSDHEAYDIIGLKIDRAGRFGNLLHQYANAIILAEKTNLRYIQGARGYLLNIDHVFELGGITFLPPDIDVPENGMLIAGEFFNSDDFEPLLYPFLQFKAEDEVDITNVIQKYVAPYILDELLRSEAPHPEDELTIHIRSGDIFGEDHPIVYGYRQPPLSFYILVIERMRAERGIERVKLVFEDRGNPCIDALEAWLNDRSIPCSTQQGDLADDIAALLNSPHLIFGHGTFGYAICRLSKSIKTVHFFAPELGGRYAHIPTIAEVYAVSDIAGHYIKAFETGKPFDDTLGWRNTPPMRQKMLDYPIEALGIEQLKP